MALLAVGILGLAALVIYEYRAENPVISVKLFRFKEFPDRMDLPPALYHVCGDSQRLLVLFAQNVMNVSATVSSI